MEQNLSNQPVDLPLAVKGDPLSPFSPVVDVIIPVYRGLKETQDCLQSVLAYPQTTAVEIIVINDCSPDESIREYLNGLAQEHRITLLENPVNLGFVNSVNRGMVLHPDRDVILLNSDTEVHGDWLDRLRRCAYSGPQVGTVTPFSNNATICSYPRFTKSNSLPEDWPLETLDKLFAEVNAGQSVEIPTAVGFCMYITRPCLNQVGYFDATLFKQGYGEENDFSMRALEIGFRHLQAADVFVYHRGGISFGEEGPDLCAEAQRILEQRHPHYFPLVGDHCARDPSRPLRRRIDNARLTRSPHPRLLFIMHKGGGGTEKHVRELAKLLEPDLEVLILRPTHPTEVAVEWARSDEEFVTYFPLPYGYKELLGFIKGLEVFRIHFHHVLDLHQQVFRLPQDLGVPYDFTLHDYYPICPQYTLTRKDGRYCGEPDVTGCAACLAERPAPWGMDILSWRKLFNKLLTGAERVIVPSQDMFERIRTYIPDANYLYLPHPEPFNSSPQVHTSFTSDELKIIFLGELHLHKGLRLLETCAIDAQVRKLPLYFRVIGFPVGEVKKEPEIPLSFYGSYSDLKLPSLIARERGDIIFFPALWPETYSYTLSYAMRSGLPIAAPRIGAFQERLANYPLAWLLDWDSSAEEWNDFFLSLLGKEFTHSDRSWESNFLNPKEYLECYTQLFPQQTMVPLEEDLLNTANLLPEKYYYPANGHRECYIDTLNRTDLLQLIQSLAIAENNQRLTPAQLISYVQGLRSEITRKQREIKRLSDYINNYAVERYAEVDRLNCELSALREILTGLYASTSWKITAPLRWASRLMVKATPIPDHLKQQLNQAPADAKEETQINPERIQLDFDIRLGDNSEALNELHIEGWVYSRAGIEAIYPFIDSVAYKSFMPSFRRPDVEQIIPGSRECNMGFFHKVDVSELTPGSHELSLVIRDKAGNVNKIRKIFSLISADESSSNSNI
jgi:GT2 family glycosyltransferase/glycosyltransferase involved in cell wall biosynthesis